MITVYTWSKAAGAGAWGGPEALEAARTADIVWVDLEVPTEEEERQVFQGLFPIHPLTLEDVTFARRHPDRPPHLPKVEEFKDYLFVVVNPLSLFVIECLQAAAHPEAPEGMRLTTQLSAVLTDRLLLTHHVQPLVTTAHLRGHLRRHDAEAERGPDYLFHLMLDVMVDQYAPLLDHFDEDLDRIELAVFNRPSPDLLLNMLQLKRTLIALRKALVYEREVLARLQRGEFRLIEDRERAYYRNVYDHLVRFTELIESSREMVTDLMQTHLAAASYKLNEIMKVLTMISTTILPMSLVAGVYGMNFKGWFPELEWEYGYLWALGLMAAAGAGAFAFFRWMKWL